LITIDIKKQEALEAAIQNQNKVACDWLLNYYQKLESYQDMINQFQMLGATQNDGMPHGSGTSNPCQNKAVSLIDIDNYKNWLIVIEQVESMLSEKSDEFLRLWRLAEHADNQRSTGRPGWYNEVRNGYAKFFQKRYGKYFLPSNGTLKNWRLRLIEVTCRLAIRKGLL
jgi:hypothetical protein